MVRLKGLLRIITSPDVGKITRAEFQLGIDLSIYYPHLQKPSGALHLKFDYV